jgi:hypothetical protein
MAATADIIGEKDFTAAASVLFSVAVVSGQHALDLGHELLGGVEVSQISKLSVKRDQQHQAERIGPQVTQAVRPDPPMPHPIELVHDVVDVLQHRAFPGC